VHLALSQLRRLAGHQGARQLSVRCLAGRLLSGIDRLIWNLTPPLLRPGARRARHAIARFAPAMRRWDYAPEGWIARARPRGWDVEPVVDAYDGKLPAFREATEGSGPLAISTSPASQTGEATVEHQSTILAFAYALALAGRKSDRVSVLDWGGGLGFYYLLARALLPRDVEIDYHCKELPAICERGRERLPQVHFHDDERCVDRRYDLVLASSALQYSEDWTGLLARLAGAAAGYLYLARMPVVTDSASFVVLQRLYAPGIGAARVGTESLAWVLNRDELIASAERSGMRLVREFASDDRSPIHGGAPAQYVTRGFLLRAALE
jgi:putative methyltransferase (TIGR04325 family)